MKLDLKPSQRRILLGSLFLAFAGFILIYYATARSVEIFVDEDQLIVRTHAKRVGAILQAAGIDLQEGDQVFPEAPHSLQPLQAIEVKRSFPIYLEVNGDLLEIITTEKSVADVLGSVGITILPGDRIWVDGVREEDPGRMLSKENTFIGYREAKSIRLQVGENEIMLRSAGTTFGEAITEAGIPVKEGDILVPAPQTLLVEMDDGQLLKAKPVTIVADGTTINTYVAAETVGEALEKAGLAIVGLDYANPGLEETIPENGQIQVVRVRDEILSEQVPIPFETTYVANAEIEIDKQVVMENGAYGVVARQIRVRYEDGEEVNRFVEGEWVAREPQPRKVGYGTKIVVRTLNTPNGQIEYWRAIQMWATSYSPSRAGVPDDYEWFGITACGKKLVKGIVAIDNRYIPFYTRMYVPGYGFAEACDVGGGVRGRWIDLGYSDQNYKSWHQYVTVYFLTPIPPANSIAWIFP